MKALLHATWVIARRDYVATVWSKTFLLFLIGPLLPVAFAVLFGSVGGDDSRPVPVVAVEAAPAEIRALTDARKRLAAGVGEAALPELEKAATAHAPDAVLTGPLTAARLTGSGEAITDLEAPVRLLLAEAQRQPIDDPAVLQVLKVRQTSPDRADVDGRRQVARLGQLVILLLTLVLAGMLLSNLIEEQSSKVIEVLAAAVPVDAIFLGKLFAMLAMSLTGIAVWGAMPVAALLLTGLPETGAAPAVGWPMFVALGVGYFVTNYLLLGALFLGIGAQATTVRQVQTLSMPVTMGQLLLFTLAARTVAHPDGPLAIIAAMLPWSSAETMLARAAQDAALWPHVLALGWQLLWIGLSVEIAARSFRRGVLLSGGR